MKNLLKNKGKKDKKDKKGGGRNNGKRGGGSKRGGNKKVGNKDLIQQVRSGKTIWVGEPTEPFLESFVETIIFDGFF